MGRITDSLNAISLTDENALQHLYSVFHSIKDYEIPIVRFTLFPGNGLIRQRINKKGQLFKSLDELTYPPPDKTPIERANLPGHPIFYACKFPSETSPEAPVPRMIALEETSSFMKDKSLSGIERATVSRWEVLKQIELIALPFIGTYELACPDLKIIKKEWQEAINLGTVPQEPLELVNYMAEEISKDFSSKEQYFKIANFVHYLLTMNTKTKNAEGIIYPSVPAQGAGFNVAIRPEVVDAKIRFSNASLCYLLKRGTEMTVMTKSDALVDEFGNIAYIDRQISDIEAADYRDLSTGLEFVN